MRSVFVGGTGRSGTTATANLLGRHSALATVPSELWVHVRLNGLCDLADSRGDLALFLRWIRESGYRRPARWQRPEGPWVGLFELIDRRTFDTLIDRFEAAYADDAGAAVVSLMTSIIETAMSDSRECDWVEHSPANVLRVSTLSRLFPDASFIHVIRDGRDVARSVEKMPWAPSDFEEAVRWWARYLRRAQRETDSVREGTVHVIRFEDLLANRAGETLAELTEFLGLGREPEPAFERFASGHGDQPGDVGGLDLRRAHVGHWRRGFPRDRQDEIDALYAGVLESLRRDGVAMPGETGVERPKGTEAELACRRQECYELWAEVVDQEAALHQLTAGGSHDQPSRALIAESKRLRASSDAWRRQGEPGLEGSISRLDEQRRRLATTLLEARSERALGHEPSVRVANRDRTRAAEHAGLSAPRLRARPQVVPERSDKGQVARLAVVLEEAHLDHLEAFVQRNEPVASVLLVLTRGADDAMKQIAARLEHLRSRVIHMDLEASHGDIRQVLVNAARMFPVDALVILRLHETLVVDDGHEVRLSLLEAGSREVRVRGVSHDIDDSPPDWLEGRVFPSSRSQLDLLTGDLPADRRGPRASHDLAGARIVRTPPSAAPGSPSATGDDAGSASPGARLEAGQRIPPEGQGSGSTGNVESGSVELAPGVFEPGFHQEQLYLDLPPFQFVLNVCRPSSVLDIGCGLGGYLAYFREQGVGRTLGIDGFGEPEAYLDPGRYRRHDLRQKLDLGERFDLVVCTEVIEHIASDHEDLVLDTIDRHAESFILFSGARPGQRGVDHINLRSTEYWVRAWQLRGWHAAVLETLAVRSLSTFHWFRRNLLLLTRSADSRGDFGVPDLTSFEASMAAWAGQGAAVIQHPLTGPLVSVRSGPSRTRDVR